MKGREISFVRLPFTQLVSKGFKGVMIGSGESAPTPDSLPGLRIAVSYQFDEEIFAGMGVSYPPETLVLTCTRSLTAYSENVLGDHVVFEDDFVKKDGFVFGCINFRLADYFKAQGNVYVTVSMGPYLSNTLILNGK